MNIETIDELCEDLADKVGVYSEKRIKFVSELEDRIREAIRNESVLDKLDKTAPISEPEHLIHGNFENYLIKVGIRSIDYRYDDKTLFDNIDYFKDCQKRGLSAYKALLFLEFHIKEQAENK